MAVESIHGLLRKPFLVNQAVKVFPAGAGAGELFYERPTGPTTGKYEPVPVEGTQVAAEGKTGSAKFMYKQDMAGTIQRDDLTLTATRHQPGGPVEISIRHKVSLGGNFSPGILDGTIVVSQPGQEYNIPGGLFKHLDLP